MRVRLQDGYPCPGGTTVNENRQSVAIRVHPRPVFKLDDSFVTFA